jgi:arginine decarboxylase
LLRKNEICKVLESSSAGDKMWCIPKKVSLVCGDAEGITKLNAFDNALLKAGIGNLNLVKVTSIIPPHADLVELPYIEPGSLTPVVYVSLTNCKSGDMISCALGAGFPEDKKSIGFIAETKMFSSAKDAELEVRMMVEEGMNNREISIGEIMSVSAEHMVKKIGCVLCAAVFTREM